MSDTPSQESPKPIKIDIKREIAQSDWKMIRS